MITKETIDNIYQAIRVEEVIADFVQLKRAGSNLKGLSPFSQEKTPSFMVSPSKQIWKDFSSGKGGNAIAFLMEHEHFSYPDALRYLAKKYNIEIVETSNPNFDSSKNDEKESLYLINEYAQKFFQNALTNTEEGKAIGLTYFKERGFTDETIATFSLGYSPNSWTALTDDALKNGYQLEFLQKSGLTIVNNDKKFDRFKGRVIFPIHSLSGRVLGFGGRILTQDKKTAKYLNSPESEVYHKSNILYGIAQAKQYIIKANNCLLVEGYTDVLQFHQSGVKNIVASSGTALTTEQIRLVSRLTQNITVLYDGDSAGLKASIRGIDLILEQGLNIKICTFPDGEDPDSFAKKTPYEDILLYLEQNTTDFITFKANLLFSQTKHDPIARAETIKEIVESIAKIPDQIKQTVYIQECASIMDISPKILQTTLYQIKNIQPTKQKKKEFTPPTFKISTPSQKTPYIEVIEKELLENLILFGSKDLIFKDIRLISNPDGSLSSQQIDVQMKLFEKLFLELQADEIELSNPLFKDIYSYLLENFQQNKDFSLSENINRLPPEFSSFVSSVYAQTEKAGNQLDNWAEKDFFILPKEEDNEQIAFAVISIIDKIRLQLISKKITELSASLSSASSQDDKNQIISEIKDYINLQKIINNRNL